MKPGFPCPEPDCGRDRNFKRVGEWTGDGYGAAKRMFKKCPAEFYRLLGWCDAEAEAAPIQMQVAQQKAASKAASEKTAKDAAKRQRMAPAPPPETAADPGAAWVNF